MAWRCKPSSIAHSVPGGGSVRLRDTERNDTEQDKPEEPEEKASDMPCSGRGQHPDGLMVFDGFCNFCSVQVQFLLRIDRRGVIRFTSIQSPYGRHLAARFGIDPDDPSTFLFFDHGCPLEASEAVIAILRRLPRPWRWLGVIGVMPRSWRDAGYRWLARHRYRLFGRRDRCMVPTPEQRSRFIDDIPDESP